MNLRSAAVALAATLALAAAAADADETYVDRARVVAVEAVFETHVLSRRHCEPVDHDAPRDVAGPPGDVRAAQPGIGLGQVLRETARPPVKLTCAPRTQRRIVGYDVTLSYGGERWVRRMRDEPGDSVPVRVRLTPTPVSRAAVHRRAGR